MLLSYNKGASKYLSHRATPCSILQVWAVDKDGVLLIHVVLFYSGIIQRHTMIFSLTVNRSRKSSL